jgi:hypothetical protein
MDDRAVAGLTIPEGLRSVRDRHFAEAMSRLREWLSDSDPDWMREACATAHAWRNPGRLAGLIHRWREARYTGDEAMYAYLEAWRKRDKHLWLWECHQRLKWRKTRNQRYRQLAKELAAKYERVTVMQADWAEMRQVPEVDEPAKQTTGMRRTSGAAAVATLEQYLIERFGRDCVVPVAVHQLTQECHVCGSINDWTGPERLNTCPSCEQTWDIDHNGVANQLARAEVVLKSMPTLATVMTQRLTSAAKPRQFSVRQSKLRGAHKPAEEGQ